MSGDAPAPDRCPLCGDDNQCGMAAGQSTCWCFDVVIPSQVLERIPDSARNRACVCPRCASATHSAPGPSSAGV